MWEYSSLNMLNLHAINFKFVSNASQQTYYFIGCNETVNNLKLNINKFMYF